MKWKTQSGQEVEINNMSTSYLVNCIKYIEKKIGCLEEDQLSYYPSVQGEMAELCCENSLSSNEVYDSLNKYKKNMKKELNNRGILCT